MKLRDFILSLALFLFNRFIDVYLSLENKGVWRRNKKNFGFKRWTIKPYRDNGPQVVYLFIYLEINLESIIEIFIQCQIVNGHGDYFTRRVSRSTSFGGSQTSLIIVV